MPEYVIVRTQSAGCFAGELQETNLDNATVKMTNARRLWYWDGAASLSELAVRGTNKPKTCKFPVAVPAITLLGVIEIIPAADAARESITGVPEWKS